MDGYDKTGKYIDGIGCVFYDGEHHLQIGIYDNGVI